VETTLSIDAISKLPEALNMRAHSRSAAYRLGKERNADVVAVGLGGACDNINVGLLDCNALDVDDNVSKNSKSIKQLKHFLFVTCSSFHVNGRNDSPPIDIAGGCCVSEPRRSCHDRVPFPSTRFHFSELSRHV
jgi:hypothetical protein